MAPSHVGISSWRDNRLKIIFLAQVPPYPPDSGPKIRNYQILQSLARKHSVTLVAFVRSQHEEQGAHDLGSLGITVITVPLRRSRLKDIAYFLASYATDEPFLIRRDRSAGMRAALEGLLGSGGYGAMHIDQLPMAQYGKVARRFGVPVVLDEHNVVSALWLSMTKRLGLFVALRPLFSREYIKLRAYEETACSGARLILTVSDLDKVRLQGFNTGTPIVSVPIGIDTARMRRREGKPLNANLLSVGTLFYPPNADGVEWFIREVYGRIKLTVPAVRLVVAGARPPARLKKIASADPSISLVGYVSDLELGRLVDMSQVMVVPVLAGGGVRVRILNAFARSIPVVTTSLGCEGLALTPGQELSVANDPRDFARAVVDLLGHPEAAESMASRAADLVRHKYDSRLMRHRLEDAYQHLEAT